MPMQPINIMMMPVVWFIIFSPLMLSLFLNLLTKKVSVAHQRNAPPKIELIPIIDKKSVDSLVINSNRANIAIKTNNTNGFENVRPNEVK